MENMFLSKKEISQLTNKKRRDSQKSALNQMGITYRETPSGELKIMREYIKQEFGCLISSNKIEKEFTPDWDALNA